MRAGTPGDLPPLASPAEPVDGPPGRLKCHGSLPRRQLSCRRTKKHAYNASELSCEKRDAKRIEREQITVLRVAVEQRALFGSFTGSVRPLLWIGTWNAYPQRMLRGIQ